MVYQKPDSGEVERGQRPWSGDTGETVQEGIRSTTAVDNECSSPLEPCEEPEKMCQMQCLKKGEPQKEDRGHRGQLPVGLWCPMGCLCLSAGQTQQSN